MPESHFSNLDSDSKTLRNRMGFMKPLRVDDVAAYSSLFARIVTEGLSPVQSILCFLVSAHQKHLSEVWTSINYYCNL